MTTRTLEHGHSGAEWIARNFKVEPSPVGRIAADILGYVYRGIYHLNRTSLKRVDWTNTHWVTVTVPMGLATYDGQGLTDLAILAHELAVRIEIDPGGPRGLNLTFHLRTTRGDGNFSTRHPTIEDAIAQVRARTTATFEPLSEVPHVG